MDGFGGLPSSARCPKKAKHGSLVAVSEAQGLGLVYGVVSRGNGMAKCRSRIRLIKMCNCPSAETPSSSHPVGFVVTTVSHRISSTCPEDLYVHRKSRR